MPYQACRRWISLIILPLEFQQLVEPMKSTWFILFYLSMVHVMGIHKMVGCLSWIVDSCSETMHLHQLVLFIEEVLNPNGAYALSVACDSIFSYSISWLWTQSTNQRINETVAMYEHEKWSLCYSFMLCLSVWTLMLQNCQLLKECRNISPEAYVAHPWFKKDKIDSPFTSQSNEYGFSWLNIHKNYCAM